MAITAEYFLCSSPVSSADSRSRDCLADAYGATLHLLHVIEDPFAGGVHMGMVGAPPEGYFEHLDQQVGRAARER